MQEAATEVTPKVEMSRSQGMTMEERMANLERNLDLCLNYVRELAQLWLTVDRIRKIESEFTDGE